MIKLSSLPVQSICHLCLNAFICSRACAIEMQDTVVVTGGSGPSATVQVYNISGPQEQLPDLRTARSGHGCAHFLDSQNRVVSTPSLACAS